VGKRKPIPAKEWSRRTFPDLEKAIMKEDALPAVLMEGALLENLLMTLLHAYLARGDTTDSLFRIGGELESFSKCARMAYCLALIPKPVFEMLTIIGEIRNLFAHAKTLIDFDNSEVRQACDRLVIPELAALQPMLAKNLLPAQGAPGYFRAKFTHACGCCAGYISRTIGAQSCQPLSEETQAGVWVNVAEGLNQAYSQLRTEKGAPSGGQKESQ
jgi:hypothetical protein